MAQTHSEIFTERPCEAVEINGTNKPEQELGATKMYRCRVIPLWSVLLAILSAGHASGDEPVPAGLDKAIANPAIPSILDVTILKYNAAGHGEIKINAIHKPGVSNGAEEWLPPKVIRGYGYAGSDKIAPLKIVAGGQTKRFLVFLDGDLLYSTYNNCFPIREGNKGAIEVGIGFNGSGDPWVPLNNIIGRIPRTDKGMADAIERE